MRKYADGAWLNAKQQNQQAQLAPVYGAVGNMANTFLQPNVGENGFVDWNNQKNVNSSIGGSTLQYAGQGAALGANPALIAATGGLSVPIGAVLGAGVGFFKGKSDVDKNKSLYNKYLTGQQTAMKAQGIQNYQSNLQQGFEPMGNAAQSKTGFKKGGVIKKYPDGGITSTDTQSPLLPKNKDYLSVGYGSNPNNTLNNNFNLNFGKKLGKSSTTDNETSFLGRSVLEGNISKNSNYDINAGLKVPFSGNTYGKIGVNNLLNGAKPFAELNAEKGWNFGGGRYNQNPIGRVNTHGNLSMTTGQDPNLKIGTGVNLNLGNNFGVNGNIDYSINKDNSGKGIALPNSNNVQGNVGLTYTPNLNSNKSSQEEQIRLDKIKRIRNSRANTYTPPSFKKGGMIRYKKGEVINPKKNSQQTGGSQTSFSNGGWLDNYNK